MNLEISKKYSDWTGFIKRNSIRRRLFIYFVLLVVLPIIFLGSISYFIAAEALERNITLSSSEMVDQISLNLELYFRQYQQISLTTLGNQFARDFLADPKTDRSSLAVHVNRLRQFLFDPIITGNYEIEGIYLAGLDGWVTGISKQANEPVLFKDPRLSNNINWLDKLPKDGSLLVSGVEPPIFGKGAPVITLARRISPARNPNQIMGVFWIDLNLQKIQDICEQVRLGKSGYIAIIDQAGKVIFHPQTNFISTQYPFGFLQRVLSSSSGHFLTQVEGIQSLVIYNTSPDTQWRLVAVVPYPEIAGGIYRVQSITIWVILFCIFASIILSIIFAATITKPIIRLQRTMEQASQGYLDRVIPVESTDEVGRLTENFNQMLQKIQRLISDNYTSKIREAEAEARQHRAELRALQAQINPHFLYNTLSTISSLAVLEGIDSISRMAETLCDFFRYSIHTEEMMVALRDELAQVERYFMIQKIRYGDRISLEIDVPEQFLDQSIVKLILQPLVENACIHGLELHGKGKITICAKVSGNNLMIRVSDNGAGIKETELMALQASLDHFETDAETGNHAHIGLRNIYARLKLHYGNEYGLKIESKLGEGTTVMILIPL